MTGKPDTVSELWNISSSVLQLSPVSTFSLLWCRAAAIVSLASDLSSNWNKAAQYNGTFDVATFEVQSD
jgi:hypothetical protein